MKRIAKGSGTRVEDVKIMLEEHKKLKGLFNKVNIANLSKRMNSSMIDPNMMSQLGDAGNLMNLMKEMSSNRNQIQEMIKSIGGGMGGFGGLPEISQKKGKGKK